MTKNDQFGKISTASGDDVHLHHLSKKTLKD